MIIYSMIHHQMLIMNTGVAMMFIKPDIYKNCHMEFYVRYDFLLLKNLLRMIVRIVRQRIEPLQSRS